MELLGIAEAVTDRIENWLVVAADPWFVFQAAAAITLLVVSKLAGKRLEAGLEQRARAIKGHPGLLRIVIAAMRRTDWILFVILLFLLVTVMRATMWPSRSWLLSIILWLAMTWVAVSIASRVIRNRFVARLVSWGVWIYAALVILGFDERAAVLLDGVALPLGDFRLSILTVLKAALLLTVALWLASAVGSYLDERVQQSEDLTPSIRVLIGKVAKFGLILIGGAIALTSVGVDLTTLTVFSGALGVGLGFGLQKVVSNFVSGIIMLTDKSIKPGDTISLGETFGWIRELRARFVSVVTRDGREYLIPNEDFVTQQVINWSFSDELVRLDVEFGVSYESDPHQVSALAIAAAMTVGRVDEQRRPVCWLTGFGESSLDFVLRFWIHDPQQGLTNVRGKVLLALWDTFKKNGVSIPYPHRDVLIRHESAPGRGGRGPLPD